MKKIMMTGLLLLITSISYSSYADQCTQYDAKPCTCTYQSYSGTDELIGGDDTEGVSYPINSNGNTNCGLKTASLSHGPCQCYCNGWVDALSKWVKCSGDYWK